MKDTKNFYLNEKDSKGIPLLRRIERYPDLQEDEFINISEHIKNVKDVYVINKRGEIKNKITGKLIAPFRSKEYFRINLRKSDKKGINLFVHRIVATVFLINPNPEIYTSVNHIDRNPSNNCLSNLEWVTSSTNSNKNKKSLKSESKLKNYIALDDCGNEVFRINIRNSGIYNTSIIPSYIKENKKYKGYYWKIEGRKNNSLTPKEEYFQKSKFSGNINDYIWNQHPIYNNILICDDGFIRLCNSNTILGFINHEGYIVARLFGKNYLVHRILMEYKYKRKLEKNEIVDHINTIRYDNRIINLRLTDSKGNSNNQLSINKLIKRKMVLTDIYGNFICYDSIPNICKITGISHIDYNMAIRQPFIGIRNSSCYFCINIGDIEDLHNKMSRMIYIISEDGSKLFGGYKSINNLISSKDLPFKCYETVKSAIKNNKTIFDGYKIITGETLIKNYNFNVGNAYKFKKDMSDEEIESLKSDAEIIYKIK